MPRGRRYMAITSQEVRDANARTKALKASTPAATAAYYDRKSKKIVVNLSTGMGLFFSPKDAQGLEDATPAQLNDIEIAATGFGLHWPQFDAGHLRPRAPRRRLSVPANGWLPASARRAAKPARTPSARLPAPTGRSGGVRASPLRDRRVGVNARSTFPISVDLRQPHCYPCRASWKRISSRP